MSARDQVWLGLWWNLPAAMIAIGMVVWFGFETRLGFVVGGLGVAVGLCFFVVERQTGRPEAQIVPQPEQPRPVDRIAR